jgi:cation transport regulator
MPYRSIVDLPSAVSEHLPIHAQDISLAAFNNAFDQYAGRPDRESAAFRVAC